MELPSSEEIYLWMEGNTVDFYSPAGWFPGSIQLFSVEKRMLYLLILISKGQKKNILIFPTKVNSKKNGDW